MSENPVSLNILAGNYLFKVNNGDIRTIFASFSEVYEIFLFLDLQTLCFSNPDRRRDSSAESNTLDVYPRIFPLLYVPF